MPEERILTNQPHGQFYGYACPITHSPLVVQKSQLSSVADGKVYKIEDGIPNFLQFSALETEEEIQKLQVLVEAGRERGCEVAIRDCDSASAEYVLDESRAKYLDLLPMNRESHVLEIGASKGQHSRLIAKRCRFLHAIDVVMAQVVFAREWCTQLGCTNVAFAVGGDDCRLPYLDGIFDVVILNYVFEWSASRSDKNPIEGQTALLAECNRTLKPGGCLFLATKNRFSARLLRGGVDEHANFRFGNALPRWLMQLVLRMKGLRRPNGLLHSYRRLSRMVMKSGFDRIKSFWAFPDARFPMAYIELTSESISAARQDPTFRNADSLTAYMLKFAPLRVIRNLAPSHVFVAFKSK
jgi:SAM-dependent methyltransferase